MAYQSLLMAILANPEAEGSPYASWDELAALARLLGYGTKRPSNSGGTRSISTSSGIEKMPKAGKGVSLSLPHLPN
jgi:hypothetical protein